MTEPQDGITLGALIAEFLSRHGDRAAFIQDDRALSYSESADLTSQLQQVLEAKSITAESRVAALSFNLPEVWLTQAACHLSGIPFTGLHGLGSVDDHVDLCDDAEIDVLIVHPRFAEHASQIMSRATTVKQLLTLGSADAGEDLLALCETVEAQPLRPNPDLDEETIALLQYTGGTTGRPKGAMISQRAMVQQAMSVTASWAVPMEPRTLIATPITHAGSMVIMPTLMRGGTVVLQQSFDPDAWLGAVQKHRINFALTVPTLLYALLDHGRLAEYDVSSFETLMYGASPMAPARIPEVQRVFGPILVQAYGQTECAGMTSSLLPREHDPINRPELLSSCGRPVAGTLVEILDDEGAPVPQGEVGEICVRSRAVMSGYWKRPEETAQALRDGWLRTSDMAYRDTEGFLHIVDRKKDMVISGGFNVYPREIEDVLAEDPTVSAAAVIGVPDTKWGEAVKAFVVARPGCSPDAESLIAAVKLRKGPHHAPKSLEIVDQLPMTKVGKIDKIALRAPYWGNTARSVN